jgi:protein-S-isoprenylcysteine O-methyltransferase Ste14
MAKRSPKAQRFATRVLIVIAITVLLFVVAQYVSFLITGTEQSTLITCFFAVVGTECGVMMLKRVSEIFAGRKKKDAPEDGEGGSE